MKNLPTNHIMLDIETMATGPMATIIQIGACVFNSETAEVLDSILINIDEEDSANYGFTVDESTKKWWASQDQSVLAGIRSNTVSVIEAVEKFGFFYQKMDRDITPVWCHTTFDFPLVQNYLKAGFWKPMNHKMAYDIRTLTGLSGVNLNQYDWSKKSHNALDDCIFQCKYVTDMLNVLRGREQEQPTNPTPPVNNVQPVKAKLPGWLLPTA